MKPMLDQPITLDLADQTGRRFAVLPPDFPQRMARRIQRKFKVKVGVDVIAELVDGYAAIYCFADSVLYECLVPVRGEYSSPDDVDDEKYRAKISAQFPDEDPEILSEIAGWTIFYYLR
ncbi:MAG: hypothetical protein WA821_02730 [Anaerolineales bacterium]